MIVWQRHQQQWWITITVIQQDHPQNSQRQWWPDWFEEWIWSSTTTNTIHKTTKSHRIQTANQISGLHLHTDHQGNEQAEENFLEKTDKLMIDQARSHLDYLTRAIQKNRIPNRLKINVKPLVMNKENPAFQRKWNNTIRSQNWTDQSHYWPPYESWH